MFVRRLCHIRSSNWIGRSDTQPRKAWGSIRRSQNCGYIRFVRFDCNRRASISHVHVADGGTEIEDVVRDQAGIYIGEHRHMQASISDRVVRELDLRARRVTPAVIGLADPLLKMRLNARL